MNKKFYILLLTIISLLANGATFGQEKPDIKPTVEVKENAEQAKKSVYDEFEEFIRIVKELQSRYVDEISLNTILTNAYRGMLLELDPYSQYFGSEELEDLKVETEGEFEGLGIEVIIKGGILTVITPILDSPAFKAGILIGDRIIKIDGESTENMNVRNAIMKLRGKLGTKITLTVLHDGSTSPVDINIERAKIHVRSIRGARIVDEEYKIGYLAVVSFQENTVKDLDVAVQDLLKKGIKCLILDLRFNPGGLLNVAVEMADKFLERGVIVSTKGRDKTQDFVYKAHKAGTYPNIPVVVLVNGGSASASEIVAGAIKDNKRGLLLGVKTFGKGSVQSLIPVGDGRAALKLTTARYYTPSGVCIHEKGIEPHVNVPLNFTETRQLSEHLSTVNIDANIGEIKEKDKSKYVDTQLERAIDVLKGIQVYAKRTGTP